MKRRKAPIEQFGRVTGTIVVLLLLMGLCAEAQQVSDPAVEFEIIPPHPFSGNAITLQLSGIWANSCVPMNPQVERIVGFEIRIATFHPRRACSQIETSWTLLMPLGPLPAGVYHVIVTYSSPSENRGEVMVIGEADFIVEAFPDISGCIRLQGAPLVEKQVILKQAGEHRQIATTDAGGCYTFNETVPGKVFQILIRSPDGP